jgi:homopolymeric O-antigen transport system ATP-binding protein
MRPIIKVEHLSKRYHIGARRASYATLRDSIAGTLRARFGGLRRNGNQEENTIWALKDVSFEVAPGEVLGVIGRNGSGKSTLLKILSRITEPTAGKVDIYGRVGSLLEVGAGFHPELSGRENIYLNGAILGMKRSEMDRKFDEIVAFAETEKFIDTPVKYYSSGMYMRLAFSVAAHLEPEILIVDEVLAVGDVRFQQKCLGKIENIARQGLTVVLVSHDMEAIRKLCRTAVLLNKGAVSHVGNTGAVVEKYLDIHCETRSDYSIPFNQEDDGPGYAYRLIIESVNGTPISSIPAGQPWQIKVKACLKRQVGYFIAGLGLTTMSGVPVRTTWSKPQTLEPGSYEMVFREDNILLCPGRYFITIGLSSFENTFFYVERAGTLEVSEYSKGIDLVRISHCGLLFNQMQVTVRADV